MSKNIKCKNCSILKDNWCDEIWDSPDEDMIRDCSYFLEKTNADRIRAMSDEELVYWIDRELPRCEWCNQDMIGTDDCSDIACTPCLLKWLQQPAQEEL